jgi:superoxide reductase
VISRPGFSRFARAFLKPGDKPEAEFNIKDEGVIAREYCNIHLLWKS